jgi:hypothetical protein
MKLSIVKNSLKSGKKRVKPNTYRFMSESAKYGSIVAMLIIVGSLCRYVFVQIDKSLSLVSFQLKRDEVSPDGKLIAAYFVSDAGATGSGGGLVSIRESDQGFDGSDSDSIVYSSTHPTGIRLIWKDETHLIIRGASLSSEIRTQRVLWHGIHILYP